MPKRLLLTIALFTLSSPASAYWEYGHETVAAIAQKEANPDTRRQVAELLAKSDQLATPTCPARTIEQASTWADCVKGLKDRFSYASSWHYQNVNVCKPFDLKESCRDGNCVSAQIERNQRLLADRTLPVRERVMALAFLVHFVGDLHQPLHAGDKSDLGGNRFGLDYGLIGGRLNAHSIWDGYLAERAITTPQSGANGLLSGLSEGEKEALAQGTVEDWSREGWETARKYAYGSVLADPCTAPSAERPVMTEETIQSLIPVSRQMVLKGGLRLARLLDEALSNQLIEE